MEYPWHHHPPPPLHPPPRQPPPPPPVDLFPFPQHNPNSHPSHFQFPNSQSHLQNPSFQSQFENPNPQLHNRNPNFHLPDRNPNFHLHDQNPNSQLPYHNPNFHLHDQNPNSQLPYHNPNFHLHDQNPSYQSHEQRHTLQLHGTNPSFLSHDQSPSFQLHYQSPSFLSRDQSPGFQLQPQNPSFRPHEPIPSFISHGQNHSFQPLEQNPSYQLHDRIPSFPSHEQYSNLQLRDQDPSFRSTSSTLQNHQIAQNRDIGVDYSPFDHGYKRPRPDELGVSDNRRMLKLIHDHGGNDSMLINVENRVHFHEDSGLKRPRFDELGVRKKYTISNLNTRYDINEHRDPGFNGFHPENELSRRPSLHTNFRDEYEPKQSGNDFDRHSYDTKNNLPPSYDARSRGHLNESAIGNHALPASLRGSPQNNISLENSHAAPRTPLFMDPKGPFFRDKLALSSQAKASSLFPISVTSASPIASSYSPFSEAQNSEQTHFKDKSHVHASNGLTAKEFQPVTQRLSMNYPRERQHFPMVPLNKPASHIFKQPHRATRPDHIVVILRGLPGSGKSYLAKLMRDLEVENGGNAPRIHTMDDYFMTEVEKVEESDNSKSSGSSRGKKPVVKMVMEYCYEAEMEEAYRSSMLKTFKKTLDEGAFPFVIVDDRNLRVADFAQFWATAKRSGYEVYLLEATYKDPVGCAARNVHGFTLDDIQKMADHWEEAPSMYLQLDAKSLLQGGDLKENQIQEVDMDTDDGESEDALYGSAERNGNISAPAKNFLSPSGPAKADDSSNAERSHLKEEVKELGRSKWSNDVEDDDVEKKEGNKGNPNALSAVFKAYKREGKSVHWGDQAANTGFSIGAAKRVNTSLQIGPGSGYNSKSNPLPEDLVSPRNSGKSKTQSVFQERIRAERDSFRAVFDRRRHRIDGLDSDEE